MSSIYFIQATPDGAIKIGWTTGIHQRIKSLRTGCPFPIKFLGAIAGTQAQEKQIHSVLSPFRQNGEWFSPHPIVLAAVQEALRVGKPVGSILKPKPKPKTHTPPRKQNIDRVCRVIDALGGDAAVADLTSESIESVGKWRSSGLFPVRKWRVMSATLKARGIVAPPTLWKEEENDLPTVSPVSPVSEGRMAEP